MKGKFRNSYVSKNGNDVFVYEVQGTKDELAMYKETQAENFREDDVTGTPLFFSTSWMGDNVNLLITSKGNCIIDRSEFKKAASLVKQAGGDFSKSIADSMANSFVANIFGANRVTTASTAVNANEASVEPLAEELETQIVDETTGEITEL